ncbi:MAG: hypothetical protein Q8M65_07345, partial [Rhodoglobus sp.]|nr:hypothetical protein [Rhodoglobus sp.]
MSTARLPNPSNAPLLIFDGDCAFCTSAVAWLERSLPVFPRTSPWQWLELDDYGLTNADGAHCAWVVASG